MLTRNANMEIYMEKLFTQTFYKERNVAFSYFNL